MIPSKMAQRVACTLTKSALPFVMLMVLAIQCMSQAGRDRNDLDSLRAKIVSWEDSLSRLNARHRPVYIGLDVSLGAPHYRLNSDINVLNNLPVSCFGGMARGVLANPAAKLKGGVGIYYSGDNVPYTFDLLTANLSVNLYLLRLRAIKYHTWEPYIFSGISQIQNKFYGHYLSDPSTKINWSSSEAPYLGSVMSSQVFTGAGVEYQLENDNREFIHLYAEVSYGTNVRTKVTTDALSDSAIAGSLWVTVGLSFGKFK